MPRKLLDSDILSEIIKGVNSNVVANATSYVAEHGVLTFTSATALEILFGLHCKGATAQIKRTEAVFDQNDEIVPASNEYRLAAEIAGAVTRLGKPIGLMDPLIAACAIQHGCDIVTGNTIHFRFIIEAGYPLHLEDWRT